MKTSSKYKKKSENVLKIIIERMWNVAVHHVT